jgi:hypothetical protein
MTKKLNINKKTGISKHLKGTVVYFNMKNATKEVKTLKQTQIFCLFLAMCFAFSMNATAGTGGTELSPLYDSIKGITGGIGGIAATAVGITYGGIKLFNEKIMPAVLSIGGGILIQVAPSIAENIITACI